MSYLVASDHIAQNGGSTGKCMTSAESHGIDNASLAEIRHDMIRFASLQLRDDAVTRRVQDTGARIDGQAVAEHAPGKHRIGNRLERNDDTTCKSRQFQLREAHRNLQVPELGR